MAYYAVFIAMDHSLLCRSFKSNTIKIYLQNAATLITRFDSINRDARNKIGESKLYPPVAAVVGAVKRYKDMKNRREPFTLGVLHLLLSQLHFLSLDSYKYALSDWKRV